MLCSLSQQKLDDCNTHLSLFGIELLVTAQLANLLIIKGLASDLLDDLDQDQFELHGRDAVK